MSTQPNSTSINPQVNFPDLNITVVCSCNSSECTDLDFRFFRKLGTVYPYLCYGTVAKGTSAKDRHNNGNIVLSNIYYEFCDKDSRCKNLKAILEWAKDYSYCAESGLKFQVRPSTVRPRPLHGINAMPDCIEFFYSIQSRISQTEKIAERRHWKWICDPIFCAFTHKTGQTTP